MSGDVQRKSELQRQYQEALAQTTKLAQENQARREKERRTHVFPRPVAAVDKADTRPYDRRLVSTDLLSVSALGHNSARGKSPIVFGASIGRLAQRIIDAMVRWLATVTSIPTFSRS
jgi:hypothetical protein